MASRAVRGALMGAVASAVVFTGVPVPASPNALGAVSSWRLELPSQLRAFDAIVHE